MAIMQLQDNTAGQWINKIILRLLVAATVLTLNVQGTMVVVLNVQEIDISDICVQMSYQ